MEGDMSCCPILGLRRSENGVKHLNIPRAGFFAPLRMTVVIFRVASHYKARNEDYVIEEKQGMRMRLRHIVATMALLVAAAALLAAAVGAAPDEQTAAPQVQALPPGRYPSPNERIGVGLVWGVADITSYDVAQLEAGWYADWAYRPNPPHPNGMDYGPLIPTGPGQYPPNWDALTKSVQRNPGQVWMVGNEPEAVFQENHTPAEYAQIYHDVYTHIKAVDATATVAIGGVILPSPLRLQWLDMVLQAYQARYGVPMPVDVWNTHMQIVNEVSCEYDASNCWGAEIPAGITANFGITMTLPDNANYDLFVGLVRDMRTWMNARGFRDKPLVISEYGVLLPSDYLCDGCSENPALGDAIVSSFMTRTFEHMLNTVDLALGYPADANRLVQRWLWYTLNDRPYDFATGAGFNGALFDWRDKVYPGTLTDFGRVFKSYVSPLKVPYVDLKPTGLRAAGASGMFTLTATVANIGNSGASAVKVRLYAGDPATGGIRVGSDAVIPSLGIRHSSPGTAQFVFAPPPHLMTQVFFAVVDPDNAVVESDKSNNSASYVIQLRDYSNRVLLPLITKNFTFGAN